MNPEITAEKGLSAKKAQELLAHFGTNEIKETRKFTLLSSFISQFNNFLTILLILAGVISFLLGEKIDSLFIFLIVILNALFGLYQEAKAEKSLETLKKLTVSMVRVRRDGKEQEIDSRFLVPGDIIFIEEGNKVPADAKILESMHLEVNEAVLTGESLPVEKEAGKNKDENIYMGTIVAKGRGYAEVSATGGSTKFGQIAKTLSTIEKVKTPLQKKMEIFSKQIGIIGILASISVFILSFIQDKTLLESFIFAVSLAVAVVPEGLPAVMTITLAIGVEKMAKKKAIIRKLNSIEALGSVTLVATDKTGTLTTNKMTVKKIWVDEKEYDTHNYPSTSSEAFLKMLINGMLCCTASLNKKIDESEFEIIGDSTEGAVLLLAQKTGQSPDLIKNEWKIIDELSFNPMTKRMTVVAEKDHERLVFTKGAPESILSVCDRVMIGNKELPMTPDKKTLIEKEFQKFACEGFRMIAFSYKKDDKKELEKDQIFLGFVGIADPVREEVKEAVRRAGEAGIKIVMITGDNELTAEAVGVETGIIKKGEIILTGAQLDKYTDEDLIKVLPETRIFARTTPDHKYRLVKLFQSMKEIVTVTGDGVNDALALKQADVGVAMGITGTDVAKETADMIVTDDNFASLINAIDYGRNIFNQTKNVIIYLLAGNLGEVIYITASLVLHLPILTPLQILYLNIATDGLPAIMLAFAPKNPDIMREKPRKNTNILENKNLYYIFFVGLLTALLSAFSVLPFMEKGGNGTALTTVLTVLILVQQLILLDIWIGYKPLFTKIKLIRKPIFLIAFFQPFLLQLIIIYTPFLAEVFDVVPLTPLQLVFACAISLLITVILEVIKIMTVAKVHNKIIAYWSPYKYKNLTLFLVSLILAFFISRHEPFRDFLLNLGNFGYIGAFFAGALFVSTFTVSIGAVILFILAQSLLPLEIALIAGIGAVAGDFTIFKIVRDNLTSELKSIYDRIDQDHHLQKTFHSKYFSWTLPVIGAIIIASPFPDELGISLMGISKIKTYQFLIISFLLNTVGIFLIVSASLVF